MPFTPFATTMHINEAVSAGFHAVLASDPGEIQHIQNRIEKILRDRHAAEADIFGIRLAVEEAVVNAIKHGNLMDRSKKVRIEYQMMQDRFEILISDEGPGFNPDDLPDPTDTENLDRPSGRGVMLMRHYMTEVRFNGRGNSVTMSKTLRNGQLTIGH